MGNPQNNAERPRTSFPRERSNSGLSPGSGMGAETGNIQHRTFNIQHPRAKVGCDLEALGRWALNVEC
jgi:hypothetical protein